MPTAAAFSMVLFPAIIRPFLSMRMDRPAPYSRSDRSMKAFAALRAQVGVLLVGQKLRDSRYLRRLFG
jgi:hypothetical protein